MFDSKLKKNQFLLIVGAPQVLRLNTSPHTISVRKGDEAVLTLTVCADPRPRHVAWEWGSLRLEAGAAYGTYIQQSNKSIKFPNK